MFVAPCSTRSVSAAPTCSLSLSLLLASSITYLYINQSIDRSIDHLPPQVAAALNAWLPGSGELDVMRIPGSHGDRSHSRCHMGHGGRRLGMRQMHRQVCIPDFCVQDLLPKLPYDESMDVKDSEGDASDLLRFFDYSASVEEGRRRI